MSQFSLVLWPLVFLVVGDRSGLVLASVLSVIAAIQTPVSARWMLTLNLMFPGIFVLFPAVGLCWIFVLLLEMARRMDLKSDWIFLSQFIMLAAHCRLNSCRVFDPETCLVLIVGIAFVSLIALLTNTNWTAKSCLIPIASVVAAARFELEPFRQYLWDSRSWGLVGFWILCLGTSWTVVPMLGDFLDSVHVSSELKRLVLRKYFHVLSLVMFCPALTIHPKFLSICLAGMLALFLGASVWDPGFTTACEKFLDPKDRNGIVVSHIYLLVGISLPIWLTLGIQQSLIRFSGLIVLGVGDSVAAVFGKIRGFSKWPGSQKSLQGSAAALLSMAVAFHILFWSAQHSFVLAWSTSVIAALAEALAPMDDNLFLSVVSMCFQIYLDRFIV